MKKIIALLLAALLVCLCASALASTATFVVDGETYATVEFEDDSRITPPAAPAKEGYVFAGWTMEDGARVYKESTKLSGDVEITARFLKTYTFEAEYTQLTDLEEDDPTADDGKKIGYGYSNNVKGLQLIQAEGGSQCNASNGYYVSSLYYNGAYLEWGWRDVVTDADHVLISTDPRIGNGGFTLTVDPDDIDTQAVITCSLNY